MSEEFKISKEDHEKLKQLKALIDNNIIQIGQLEYRKTKIAANVNQYQLASEKLIQEIIKKYNLPADKKLIIEDDGTVTFPEDKVQDPNLSN